MHTVSSRQLAAGLVAVVVVGCQKAAQVGPTGVAATHRPTPAAPFSGVGFVGTSRATIIRFATDSLKFREDLMGADGQHVRQVGGVLGPYIRIEPEIGVRWLSDTALANGRFIARAVADRDYRPLGVVRGKNYLWVDSVATGRWRAIMVSENDRIKMYGVPFTVPRLYHDSTFLQDAQAKFLDEPGFAPALWVDCRDDCCIICGGDSGGLVALDSIRSAADSIVMITRALPCDGSILTSVFQVTPPSTPPVKGPGLIKKQ